jgi:hypothetical protein
VVRAVDVLTDIPGGGDEQDIQFAELAYLSDERFAWLRGLIRGRVVYDPDVHSTFPEFGEDLQGFDELGGKASRFGREQPLDGKDRRLPAHSRDALIVTSNRSDDPGDVGTMAVVGGVLVHGVAKVTEQFFFVD